MTVNRLSRNHIEGMAERVAGGKKLPDEVLQQIVEKTDGVPLFVEEITKAVLESGVLKEGNGQYELAGSFTTLTIPATLQDSLMARLDRLVTAKAVAQYAAVIGRQFSYQLLQAVSQLDETMLQHELKRLVDAELLYQRGLPPQTTYTFKHALIQDTAYESLLRSTRQQYHQRIGQVLEERFPETAETQPELLAHHYTEAGLNEQAVGYWHKAGQKAIERSANVEAMHYFTTELEVLKTLPDTPERTQQELATHIDLGVSMLTARGYAAPEVEQVYSRALALCQQVGNPLQTFQVLRGLADFHVVHAEIESALAIRQSLLETAQQQQDVAMLVVAHESLGLVRFMQGELCCAYEHFAKSMTLYDAEQHRFQTLLSGQNRAVTCLSYTAAVLWHLGYPEQALHTSRQALDLAEDVSHSLTLAHTLGYTSILHHNRREISQTLQYVEATLTLAKEQGLAFWEAVATIFRGWIHTSQEQYEQGIADIRQGLEAYRVTGAAINVPSYLVLLAKAYGKVSNFGEGLRLLTEALALVDKTGERRSEAELYRVKGELLLQQSPDNHTEAETSFQKALDVARSQEAKSWELRAATSLSRLWKQQGKREKARNLLAEVYDWFTEGFDTKDLQEAKGLLDELAERQ
jgi:predicted ATPase